MRLLHYFKQAWNLIQQEKLFSSIYIIGTGLSITVVMVLSIVFYLRIANIYPETNRDRLLIVKSGVENYIGGGMTASSLSYKTVETCFLNLEHAEAVTVICNPSWRLEEFYVQPDGSKEQVPVTVMYVDTAFWKVFPFRYADGKSFTAADFQSGIPTAVIAESLAKRLYGTVEATGRPVSLNFRDYRVCGVVKDASFVTSRVYAQLYLPYTVNPAYRESSGMEGDALGPMKVYILSPSKKAINKVKAEVVENLTKYDQSMPNVEFTVNGQPDRQWQTIFRFGSNDTPDFTKILSQYGFVFLILLLTPAISLSGMTDSRMERRLAEMGVRRAFGAPIGVLMRQIIYENCLFIFLGGLAGLIFSYLIVLFGRNWILQIGQTFADIPPEGVDVWLAPSMLLNFSVFGIALAVSLLLNLFSSLIPAWRASRREIIFSLNAKL
jgi:putative ABC transport system permease protein